MSHQRKPIWSIEIYLNKFIGYLMLVAMHLVPIGALYLSPSVPRSICHGLSSGFLALLALQLWKIHKQAKEQVAEK